MDSYIIACCNIYDHVKKVRILFCAASLPGFRRGRLIATSAKYDSLLEEWRSLPAAFLYMAVQNGAMPEYKFFIRVLLKFIFLVFDHQYFFSVALTHSYFRA